MRNLCCVLMLAVLAVAPAVAGTLNVSTGLDSSYNLIVTNYGYDAHWQVNGNAAQVVMPGNPDWYGGWLVNGPNSNWIAISAETCCASGAPYTFSTTFYIADPSVASIAGLWTIDDAGTLTLNGMTLSSLGNGNWGSMYGFGASGSSWFVAGWNTLAITMDWTDNYLEGVRLEGTVEGVGQSPIPEPTSLMLLLSAAGGVVPFLRKRLG